MLALNGEGSVIAIVPKDFKSVNVLTIVGTNFVSSDPAAAGSCFSVGRLTDADGGDGTEETSEEGRSELFHGLFSEVGLEVEKGV